MKVFLSSTGRDLKDHREAASEALQGMGMHCVRMEDFHGAAIRIEDFDDAQIADCDLFVILIGHLYGTCPKGSVKSYTELEYATAVRLAKPSFLFLAAEDFSFPANLRECDDQHDRVRAFRESAAGLNRNFFTSPEDLKTSIIQAIYHWEQTEDGPPNPSTHRCNLILRTHTRCSQTSLVGSTSAECSRIGSPAAQMSSPSPR